MIGSTARKPLVLEAPAQIQASAPEPGDWRVRMSERVSAATRTLGAGLWEWDLAARAFTWDQRTFELFGVCVAEPNPDLGTIFRVVHP